MKKRFGTTFKEVNNFVDELTSVYNNEESVANSYNINDNINWKYILPLNHINNIRNSLFC